EVSEQSYDYKQILMSYEELEKTLRKKVIRRIILSTNVAESGVTISTVKYVIDSGLQLSPIIFYPENVFGMVVTSTTQTNIEQRRGRAGRLSIGFYYPLYSEKTYSLMDQNQKPELTREGFQRCELLLLLQISDYNNLMIPSKIPGIALSVALEELVYSGFA